MIAMLVPFRLRYGILFQTPRDETPIGVVVRFIQLFRRRSGLAFPKPPQPFVPRDHGESWQPVLVDNPKQIRQCVPLPSPRSQGV